MGSLTGLPLHRPIHRKLQCTMCSDTLLSQPCFQQSVLQTVSFGLRPDKLVELPLVLSQDSLAELLPVLPWTAVHQESFSGLWRCSELSLVTSILTLSCFQHIGFKCIAPFS